MITTSIQKRPQCNADGCENDAHFDAQSEGGTWGYFCEAHFYQNCNALGTGLGQILLIGDGKDDLTLAPVCESDIAEKFKETMDIHAYANEAAYLAFALKKGTSEPLVLSRTLSSLHG